MVALPAHLFWYGPTRSSSNVERIWGSREIYFPAPLQVSASCELILSR